MQKKIGNIGRKEQKDIMVTTFRCQDLFTPLFSGIKGNIGNDEADHSQETQLNAFQDVFCNQHPKTLDGMTEDKNKV